MFSIDKKTLSFSFLTAFFFLLQLNNLYAANSSVLDQANLVVEQLAKGTGGEAVKKLLQNPSTRNLATNLTTKVLEQLNNKNSSEGGSAGWELDQAKASLLEAITAEKLDLETYTQLNKALTISGLKVLIDGLIFGLTKYIPGLGLLTSPIKGGFNWLGDLFVKVYFGLPINPFRDIINYWYGKTLLMPIRAGAKLLGLRQDSKSNNSSRSQGDEGLSSSSEAMKNYRHSLTTPRVRSI